MEIKIERLYRQAVDAALRKNWETAIAIHKEILALQPDYLDSHLALAFAYLQNGNLQAAKASYKAALSIDPVNVIARNNIDRINVLMKKGGALDVTDDIVVTSSTFMHTEGKTRIVTLSNIGQADVLAMLKIGEHVELKLKKRRVEVRNRKGEYVGCLPDDISKRLAFFIESGSEYDAIIKASAKNGVDIFLKETKKGSKVAHYISFPENIQDDLKTIMSRDADEDSDEDSDDDDEDGEGVDIVPEEEEDEDIEDIEELAKETDDDGEYVLTLRDEDEDEDEEDES